VVASAVASSERAAATIAGFLFIPRLCGILMKVKTRLPDSATDGPTDFAGCRQRHRVLSA
jgi:hypothetical protein